MRASTGSAGTGLAFDPAAATGKEFERTMPPSSIPPIRIIVAVFIALLPSVDFGPDPVVGGHRAGDPPPIFNCHRDSTNGRRGSSSRVATGPPDTLARTDAVANPRPGPERGRSNPRCP